MADFCLQVIDNFFDHPDQMRKQALSTDIDITGGNPGLSSLNIDVEKNMFHVGEVLKIEPDFKHLKHICLFRMTKGSDEVKFTDIHVDGPIYAGVCYLNLPEQCSGGVSFYRHKKTGLEHWPSRKETKALIKAGLLPPEVVSEEEEILYWEEEGRNRERWEQTIHIPMKYNRAAFYYGNQFHTMSTWKEFGEEPDTARMTFVYFFHEK